MDRIQRFTRSGAFIDAWPVGKPQKVHADRRGSIYVCGYEEVSRFFETTNRSVLSVFTTAGALQRSFVGWNSGLWAAGVDRDGFIYEAVGLLADLPSTGIQKLDPDGTLVGQWARGTLFNDVIVDSTGFVDAVSSDSLFRFTTDGDRVAAWPYGGISLTEGSDGDLVLLDTDRVTRVDSTGKVVGGWQRSGSGERGAAGTGGIATTLEGTLLIADTPSRRVEEVSRHGVQLDEIGGFSDQTCWPVDPCAVAVDDQGAIYLGDLARNAVAKFNSRGDCLLEWGHTGSKPGEFRSPRGIAVGGSGHVYVWDTGNRRVQVFDSEGRFLRSWPAAYRLGTVEPWPVTAFEVSACGIAATRDDVVYLTDRAAHRVVAFAADGTVLGAWGGPGSGPGQFDKPRDVAVGPNGNVYVVDFGNRRIQVFQPSP